MTEGKKTRQEETLDTLIYLGVSIAASIAVTYLTVYGLSKMKVWVDTQLFRIEQARKARATWEDAQVRHFRRDISVIAAYRGDLAECE